MRSTPIATHDTPTSFSEILAWEKLFHDPRVRALLEKYKSTAPDPLQTESWLRKDFTATEQLHIRQWLALQPKLQKKFGSGPMWLADSFACEQATTRILGQWKAALWPSGIRLADLCCGAGGDSLNLDASIEVIGVDLDFKRLLMFRHNTAAAGTPRPAICADILRGRWPEFIQVDPARRARVDANQRDPEHLRPTWPEILELCTRADSALIKLPPAFAIEMIPRDASILYLGRNRDCLECLVALGDAFRSAASIAWNRREPVIAAVNCERGEALWIYRSASLPALPVRPPGPWIYEPHPCAVRAHTFTAEAARHALWLLDPQIAYLSGETRVESPWLDAYQVLDYGPLDRKIIQGWLRRHGIGSLTIKKRGVDIDIDDELRRYKTPGDQAAVLFYSRARDQRIAILTRPQTKKYH